MPPGQRPFTPIDQSAKLDFAKKLMGRVNLENVFGGPNLAEQIGTGLRTAVNSVVTTPLDVADWGVQQLEKYVGGVKPKDHFDPASMGGTNFVGETYRGINQASNRVAGDIAAIPGVGKPSASPTASDIRKYGVAEGVGRAAVDYGNLAAMAYPAAKAGIAGRIATKAAETAVANPYVYGVHVSPMSDLAEIQARRAMQAQSMAGDAMAGSSYMWDAQSPRTIGSIFNNPQLNPAANSDLLLTADELAALPKPNIYVTRAPAGAVFQDANVPGSAALRVAGNQEVLAQVPFDEAALRAAMEQYAGAPRSLSADVLEARYRGLNPVVRRNIADRPAQLAEENLRLVIARGPNPYLAANYPSIFELNPNASLPELLSNPDAKRFYDGSVFTYRS